MKRGILYLTYSIQKDEKFICGHLGLAFLYEIVFLKIGNNANIKESFFL